MEVREGLEGVIACKTSISRVEVENGKAILEYRGYNIHDLAKHSTYEETAYLLLFGELPRKKELKTFEEELKDLRELPAQIIGLLTHLPPFTHPMVVLRTAVSYLGSMDREKHFIDYDHAIQKAKSLIAKIPTIIAYYHRIRTGQNLIHPHPDLKHAENFLYMLKGEMPDRIESRALDVDLILHADHELNASTFTARVAASTLADIYACVVAATGALMGPLHGGAAQKVIEMFREIAVPWRAEEYVIKKLERKERIMGFGHRVYKNVLDPRVVELRNLARKLAKLKGSKWFEIAEEVAKAVHKHKGLLPNVDFYSACIYASLNIPDDLYIPIFAMGRIAGWTAHIIEQYINNRLIRPRAFYIGQRDRKYTPLRERT